MISINKNNKGNPNHDELGRFCRAEDVEDGRTDNKSSGYSKNQYLQGKSWEELKKMGKQNEFIEVNFTTPITLKFFKSSIIRDTEIQDLWEPADYDQKFDRLGVDVIGESNNGEQYVIDFKCLSGQLGNDIDVVNATHNVILFRFDPNKNTEEEPGWIFKDNLTQIIGFTAINTPYNQEQLFNLGNERTKNKYVNSACLFLVPKDTLKQYILSNFMNKQQFLNKFREIKSYLQYTGRNYKKITIRGQDGVNLTVAIGKDKVTGGYFAELKIPNIILREKCQGRGFYTVVKR